MTLNIDAKFNALGSRNYRGSQEDRELLFYKDNGATSNSLPDAELQFLTQRGFNSGVLSDRWKAYLNTFGYRGSVDDMLPLWWREALGSSLYLDFTTTTPFASTSGLDPRITFNRTTNATLTNSAGLIANAPMNLLTFSEQFDNAAWTKVSTSVTANTTVAPNGTTTADTVSISGSLSNVAQTFALGPGTYTLSVYVKSLTVTTPGTLRLLMTVDSVSQSFTFTPTAEWTRQTFTVTAATSLTTVQPIRGQGYIGDVAIWGAQLETNATATTYNPTTVKNLLGFAENFDNAAWTKSNAFVQTNLILQSQALATSPWTTFIAGTGVTPVRTNDYGVAPDGTQTATRVQLSLGGGTTTSDRSLVNQQLTPAVGTQYTLSIWVRSLSGNASFSLQGDGFLIPTTLTATSEWQRFVVTGTVSFASTPIGVQLRGGQTPAHSNSADLLVWGAQLVQGTTPGDYKATYAAAAAVGYTDIYGQPFAQKLVENTANNKHQVSNATAVTTTLGQVLTFSLYAKAAERSQIYVESSTGIFGPNITQFDLANGTVVSGGGQIVGIGNGWYRCSTTVTVATAGSASFFTQTGNGTTNTYTGDGTSGIYIFGAQLSDSASVDPYVYQPVAAPASTAYYGPRFDYDPVTLQPKGLLIEEQRTNLLLNTSILGTQVVTVTAAAHTLSFYGTGTIVLSGAFVGTVTGTGAYPTRTTLTFTPIVGVLTVTVTGSVTSAQLEAGAFATSYIPTVASQVTRAADSASMIGNNFARWYNQTQGTLFVQGITSPRTTAVANAEHVVSITSTLSMLRGASSVSLGWFIGSASFRTFSFTSANALFKSAGAYLAGDNAATLNGGSLVTDSGSTYGSPSSLFIGANSSGVLYMNGTIARIAYYNRRLANTELTAITS